MKFAHIADTHIKNLKYHFEYRKVFTELYDILRKEQVDYIIHCGDIAHTKTQLSPEFVEMCSDFFVNLAITSANWFQNPTAVSQPLQNSLSWGSGIMQRQPVDYCH